MGPHLFSWDDIIGGQQHIQLQPDFDDNEDDQLPNASEHAVSHSSDHTKPVTTTTLPGVNFADFHHQVQETLVDEQTGLDAEDTRPLEIRENPIIGATKQKKSKHLVHGARTSGCLL